MNNNNFFKSNWIYILWCFIYFLITWLLLGANFISFAVALLIYGISILIALSPLGEAILRLFYDVRTIDTRKEKEYLNPIFEEVYTEAKQFIPNLKEIQLFIIDTMNVNACAIGFKTVAVTRGAIQTLTEDELKGILAHEIGHIARGHTIATLLSLVGNGIFTLIMIVSQFFMNIFTALMSAGRNPLMRIMVLLSRHIFNVAYMLFMLMIQAILAVNSRKNEFEADYFAYEIGYGENLLESLYVFHEDKMNRKKTIKDKLIASHPHTAKRIARLEDIIDNEEIQEEKSYQSREVNK